MTGEVNLGGGAAAVKYSSGALQITVDDGNRGIFLGPDQIFALREFLAYFESEPSPTPPVLFHWFGADADAF